MRRLLLTGLAFVLLLALAAGCGAAPVAPGPFELVDQEDTYLNSRDNDGRPPISFYLIGSTDAGLRGEGEVALVDAYVEAMRKDGWRVSPSPPSTRDWWTHAGRRGSDSVRVGPASTFADLARIGEGWAPIEFDQLADELGDPLVVMSVDPMD